MKSMTTFLTELWHRPLVQDPDFPECPLWELGDAVLLVIAVGWALYVIVT